MKSMTGFYQHFIDSKEYLLAIEIKTLNARFLDLYCNIPNVFNGIEMNIRQKLKEHFQRGSIYLNIQFSSLKNKYCVPINFDFLNEIIRQLEQKCGIQANIDLANLFRIEEFKLAYKELLKPNVQKLILKELEYCIHQVKNSRIQEGKELTRLLNKDYQKISHYIHKIEEIYQREREHWQHRQKEKLSQYLRSASCDMKYSTDILINYFLRSSCEEELKRFYYHLMTLNTEINSSEVSGKKIDFLLQELNREINTLNNKSICGEIQTLGIEIKMHIEHMREQSRNIE